MNNSNHPSLDLALNSQENEIIDIKSDFYHGDTGANELLKDVTAFANFRGGLIAIGFEEDSEGRVGSAPGVDQDRVDTEISRMQSVIQSGTEPELSSCRIYSEQSADGRCYVFLDIGEGNLPPHRIIKQGKYRNRFYIRNGRQNIEMTTDQLRNCFQYPQQISQRTLEFVASRIELVRQGKLPHGTYSRPAILCHITPTRKFGSRVLADYAMIEESGIAFRPSPSDGALHRAAPNQLGVIVRQSSANAPYTQIFHNGAVELLILGCSARDSNSFHSHNLVEFLTENLKRMLRQTHKALGDQNYDIHIAILDADHTPLLVFHSGFGEPSSICPHLEIATIPSIRVAGSAVENTGPVIKVVADAVWGLWGFKTCNRIDDDGNRVG